MNNNNEKSIKCSRCLYFRVLSVVSKKELERCDKCERIWIKGREPTDDEVIALTSFALMNKEERKELKEKVIELINQGII